MCVHPWTKVFPPPLLSQFFHHLSHAGGHSSFHQSVANEATDDWRGYAPGTPGSRTCFQHIDSNGPPCCCSLVSWFFFMIPSHKQVSHRSFPPLVKHFFNNSSHRTFSPCCSIAILPIVVIESLNTSVRVCFAQPSHSGAECDPRHRGAAFCIGVQQPQRTTSTGPSPEVMATPIESTDALAAGPKHGSFLFHQLSDQSRTLFSTCCIFSSAP